MESLFASIKKSSAELYAKLKDLYWSMTLGNRIIATLLMATLLVSLGYLIVGSFKPAEFDSKTVKLYDGYRFSPNEKGAAESAMMAQGLTERNWVGDQLLVPSNKEHLYTAVLAEANVLQPSGTAIQDAVKGLTPLQTGKLQDTIMSAAQERNLIDTIRMLPGIRDARIHKTKRPEWNTHVFARRLIYSVNVTVYAVDNKPLPDGTIAAIGNIVSRAFGITDTKDIKKEITIVDANNNRSYNGAGNELIGAQAEYARYQTKYQDEWNDRIYELLPSYDGVKVDTNVILTTYRSLSTFGVEHGKPTDLVTHTLDYQFLKEGYNRWWRPGAIAQFQRPLIDPTGTESPTDKVDEKKSESEVTKALQGTETERDELPYIPQQVKTTIQIPKDYLMAIWRQNHPANIDPESGETVVAQPTPEELQAEIDAFEQTYKRAIAKLIEDYRLSNKTDPMELVEIIFYDRLMPEESVLTAWQHVFLFLRENWQNLGLMSLVLCGIGMLWLISKPQKQEPIVIYEGLETPLEAIDARMAEKLRREEAAVAAREAEAEAQEAFENSLGDLGSIRSLRDEIAELIAKNPEAAAAVIRQWIGNAVLVEAKN